MIFTRGSNLHIAYISKSAYLISVNITAAQNIETIDSEASILTTSLYDIHIRRWLKNFDRGNMLIMDGRSLQTQPIVAIRRVQNFLRVSDSIPSKAFNFNNTIGLFCLHLKYITMEDRVECPDRTDFLRML